MSIRKRTSKKAKNGYVYEVYFPYKINGIIERYSKSGFKTKKEAQEHEALMLAELKENGSIKTVKTLCKSLCSFDCRLFLFHGPGDWTLVLSCQASTKP